MTLTKLRNIAKAMFVPQRYQPPYSHICQLGDPVLREKCQEISPDTIKAPEVQTLIQHMVSVMRDFDCVGLACNQIGMPYRIVTMEFKESLQKIYGPKVYEWREMKTLPLTVLINPILQPKGFEKVTFVESCASVKGFSADVARYKAVSIDAFNQEGEKVCLELSGWNARIAQHEIDHLDGIAFTDRMDVKTLQCTSWQIVNEKAGRVCLPFYPKK